MAEVENVVSGAAHGAVVQAGTIDSVHIHSTSRGQPTPYRLPPAPRVFVSRDEELTEL